MRSISISVMLSILCGAGSVFGAEPSDPDAAEDHRDRPSVLQQMAEAAVVSGVVIDPSNPGQVSDVRPASGSLAETDDEGKRGNFVVAPIPISTSTIGSGLAALALYVFRPFENDEISPPTTIGVGGLYTDNDSWAAAVGGKTYLHEDRWRLTGVYGRFDFNYPFFGTGNDAGEDGRSIRLDQLGDAGMVEVLRKLGGRWYAGLRFTVLETTIAPDLSPDFELPPAIEDLLRLETTIAAVGVRVQYDSRDDVFAPRTGTYVDLQGSFAREAVGSDWEYENYIAAWNGYWNKRERDVVAARAFACSAADAPFFDLCQFGAGADLRGYTGGRYRDEAMVAVQTEYRYWFRRRWAATAFVGVGEVAPSFGEIRGDNLLPAGGVGLRWRASKTQRLGLRVDYAWGKNDQAFYVSVGEAF